MLAFDNTVRFLNQKIPPISKQLNKTVPITVPAMPLFDEIPPGKAGETLGEVVGVCEEPDADENFVDGELSLQDCGPIATRRLLALSLF